MSRTASRVLWAVAGALLVISGVICLLYPEVALATLALYLGFVLLVCGVIDIVIFVKGHKFLYGAGWFLVDGILTVVISLFLLFNNAFTMLTLPFLFGMWLLMSGISKAVNSFDLKALGVSGWGWFLAFGIVIAALGFLSFINPVAGALTLGSTVGFVLILQGIGSILRAAFSGRLRM